MNKKLLAYLQLFRLPNVFTAVSNVVMGFMFTKWFVDGGVIAWPFVVSYLMPLVLSSCCLYIGGMVLNDVYDYEVDKAERPDRPLPSGRIDLAWARKLGFGLLLAGIGLAFSVVSATPKPGMLAILLAVAIYLYDSVAKQTAIAPVLMGCCRMLNIMLGMSYVLFSTDQLLVAFGIGTYVAGITWFARCEAKDSDRKLLSLGFGVMMLGICILAAWPWFRDGKAFLLRDPILWPTLLALLMVSVVRRCVVAISNPEPEHVQAAVKHAIFSLIVLDGAVVLAAVGPLPAIAVIALLLPTIWLGKWIYST